VSWSRHRYRGTDVDGPLLDPEGLWVRGENLTAKMGRESFAAALLCILTDQAPSQEQVQACDRLLRDGLQTVLESEDILELARRTSALSRDPISGLAAGLLALSAQEGPAAAVPRRHDVGVSLELRTAMAAAAMTPALLAASIEAVDGNSFLSHRKLLVREAQTFADAVLGLARGSLSAREPDLRLFEAILVAWHAGFGYITPTVLVPRAVIGTGASLVQAMAAGCLASGPHHIGACQRATAWFANLHQQYLLEPTGTDLTEFVRAKVMTQMRNGQVIYGFGHPLFKEDPRPPVIRRLLLDTGCVDPFLPLHDAVAAQLLASKQLRPNIDAATAIAFMQLGIRGEWWGLGLGLCARTAAMLAHAIERRGRPPFGLNSRGARAYLAAVPVGWL
jgi:citrate synthase